MRSLRKKGQNTTKKSQSCEITDKKIISIKKKGQNTTKKSQSCVIIVKLQIKNVLSSSSDNPCLAKKKY